MAQSQSSRYRLRQGSAIKENGAHVAVAPIAEYQLAKVRFGSRIYDLPGSRVVRIILGILLIIFGILGFLPVLGFWMIPLGLVILSADIPVVRRINRRATVAISRWWTGRKARRAR